MAFRKKKNVHNHLPFPGPQLLSGGRYPVRLEQQRHFPVQIRLSRKTEWSKGLEGAWTGSKAAPPQGTAGSPGTGEGLGEGTGQVKVWTGAL